VILKEKYVHKSEADISKMVASIQQSFIEDWQWTKIIERMYDPGDCVQL